MIFVRERKKYRQPWFCVLTLAMILFVLPVHAGPFEKAKTKFAESEGVKFAYRDFGRKSAIPILMSQRFRGSMDDWDPEFLNVLAKKRRVIVFDSVGVHQSSGTVPTSIKGMADAAISFLDALNLERVDLVGWSMGGFIAQVMPIEYPERVRRVVLIGTGPSASPETPATPEITFQIATKPEWRTEDHEYLFFAATESDQSATDSIERISRRRDGNLSPATTLEVMQNQAAAIIGFLGSEGDYFNKLKQLHQPTLIIMGDRDAFFPIQGSPLLLREIPNAQLAVYPLAGHGPQHQFPVLIGEQILRFLR